MNLNPQPNNPLHGITLETMLIQLVEKYGWLELSRRIPLRCFYNEPSIKSSLKFLRRTPWARKAVEDLYLDSIEK
ncbi:MAG: VF530 family DNA-binding protein [Anaerolineaceae bacterium]